MNEEKASEIIKRKVSFSRNDFGLPGDGTKEYMHFSEVEKCMEEYATWRLSQLPPVDEMKNEFITSLRVLRAMLNKAGLPLGVETADYLLKKYSDE